MVARKIANNTLALFVRQVVVAIISLYAVRVLFRELGVTDYGIYSAVAGFVALLSFFPASMASATQRYFSFALGASNDELLKQTFSTNLLIYSALALVVMLLLEIVGFWFIKNQLSFPEARMDSVTTLYHFVVFSFVTSLISSPFIAILIAHEDMIVYAVISVVEVMLKLTAAFLLETNTGDLLPVYGILLFLSSLSVSSMYAFYCIWRYKECRFLGLNLNWNLAKEIIGFTGWTLFGQFTTVSRNQAVTVLLNQNFSPATVAARAIAVTVASQVSVFSNHLNTGLYPAIIKSYAANNKSQMFLLVFTGSKLTFFLMWAISLPLLLQMKEVLSLWLENPPSEAILFTRLAVVESLVVSISLPLATSARAPGRVRGYELSLGSLQLLIFVLSWWVLWKGFQAHTVFLIAIAVNIVMFQVRLQIVSKLIGLSQSDYYREVIKPAFFVVIISAIPLLFLVGYSNDSLVGLLLLAGASFCWVSVVILYLGLDAELRKQLYQFFKTKLALLK
ncbi:lipopolysaccharide biosynthesis protein [Teredinibacter turnerae]|uniref:lipopolysaccharide biosynthesis protein n=1 Tax=Teredinibacter turnerae TaxID=2426 RepID=UPI0004229093|nr:hypothetical protein [Teredinibacter turnerae]